MDQYKKEAVTAFEEFAKNSGLVVRSRTDTFIDVVGSEIGLRVRWRVERTEGIFVTLFQVSEPRSEFSLVYLVEFENGSSEDIELAKSNDPRVLVEFARRYCTKFLSGNLEKFRPFKDFAKRRIAEQVPSTPEMKATKWIRPEW